MENYMEYKIMGSVKQVKIKPGTIPSKLLSCTMTQRLDLVQETGESSQSGNMGLLNQYAVKSTSDYIHL